ncbi:hypothetical protein BJ322DRAFT_882244 [Thelephora terrestris]|uniref:Uncharacterized protein n=1 Tax=Thelephora terrestris TaxID=56493 RepID=A0A9P6L647_9AGAM|nr:hypothetical protein BJ322DRAFT_882244 [Thelephora terrestris]
MDSLENSTLTGFYTQDTSLSADSQIFGKLLVAVREPLVPLYEKFPLQTFQLAAAIFSFLFYEKIVIQLTAGNRVLQSSWEGVAESLLSGVLDFLEMRSDGATLRTLAQALYPVLCSICFSTAFCSSITMGSNLRYVAFTLLVDSANEPTNKEVLRDPEYLGSRRLGATLYGSKDYVILENLFLLVLIVAPKFESMDKRSGFMREVFVANYPQDTICGESLARMLAKPTERDSDLLQAQAIEILAKSNLMFPQPFDVSHIDSCGLRFPQTPPQQRLIVDYKSLLANVIKDDGYESFRVSFDQICGIAFASADKPSFVKVVVGTSSAPTIQLRPLKVPDGQSPSVTFEIGENDVLRFKRALRTRGIVGPPHISVSQEGPRLEFDREGNAVPDILASVVQTIERCMQLSQRSDDSLEDLDNQDHEDYLSANESPVSPSARPTIIVSSIPQEATAAASSRPLPTILQASPDIRASQKTQTAKKTVTTLLDTKLADVTPSPRVPRQPSVFVPVTPSQVKHRDVFGSGDTDLSELSDDSEADSMKALSQKLAARTDSLNAITKRAPILADTLSPVCASGKNVAKRRVLDSGDEEALSNFRKGAKGGSKFGAGEPKKATPTAVFSDEDDLPPPPAPLKKGRPKATKKPPGPLNKDQKPLVRDDGARKREREDGNDSTGKGGAPDAQENPPPVKRARKTTGGKSVAIRPKAVSPVPALIPTPPRDSQVLKKARVTAKRNANYGGRPKSARPSSPARDFAGLSEDRDSSDTLDLKTGFAEPHVEPALVDGGDYDYVPSPVPKSKPKSKAAEKPKSTLAGKSVAEKPKRTTVKAKAKTQAGTRTRAAATKAKGVDDEKVLKVDPPRKEKPKPKTKKKAEAVSADEGGREPLQIVLSEGSPVAIEITSSPPEPSRLKRQPVSRVTVQEVYLSIPLVPFTLLLWWR